MHHTIINKLSPFLLFISHFVGSNSQTIYMKILKKESMIILVLKRSCWMYRADNVGCKLPGCQSPDTHWFVKLDS